VNPRVRTIPYVKAVACGNDFLLIDGALAPEDISGFTRTICDRHEGVGADGVEWMLPHFSADLEIRLMNADGSPAEISGNGTRCAATYYCSQHGKERISVMTGAGMKVCNLVARRDSEYEFEAEIGEAAVDSELVLTVAGREVRGIPVSNPNPHYVMFVSEFAPDWQVQAAEIQRNRHFVQGVNIELVIVQNKHEIEVRYFERGVGETKSSGMGSCASVVASIAAGRAESPVKVNTLGGTQMVRMQGKNIFLRGSARLVATGEYLVG
jgi:diaminopimelate epimerase